MNEFKLQMKQKAKEALESKGISFESFNNDLHWKIGSINFYPTTGKWMDEASKEEGHGYKELIKYISPAPKSFRKLSVEQIFDIAKKSKKTSLLDICEAIHKEVYK